MITPTIDDTHDKAIAALPANSMSIDTRTGFVPLTCPPVRMIDQDHEARIARMTTDQKMRGCEEYLPRIKISTIARSAGS